jgi:ribulose-5-phosphate 4-epimerase/fuculose-1-phosphate aldolase
MNRLALIAALALCAAALPLAASAQQTPPPAAVTSASVATAVEDLVVASRILADRGILDAYGHVSIRHPADPDRFLMSRARAPALVTAADVMEFDLDSNPLDRQGRAMFIERFIHGEIYKQRPDVNAIVHSHSSGVIPFGITTVPLRPVYHSASFLYVGVPVFEIRDAGGITDLLVRDAKLGKALALTLADKPVALMRGHGDVVVGRTVQNAVAFAIFTEENARLQAAARALGGPINYVTAEEGARREAQGRDEARSWELWKAKALGR